MNQASVGRLGHSQATPSRTGNEMLLDCNFPSICSENLGRLPQSDRANSRWTMQPIAVRGFDLRPAKEKTVTFCGRYSGRNETGVGQVQQVRARAKLHPRGSPVPAAVTIACARKKIRLRCRGRPRRRAEMAQNCSDRRQENSLHKICTKNANLQRPMPPTQVEGEQKLHRRCRPRGASVPAN